MISTEATNEYTDEVVINSTYYSSMSVSILYSINGQKVCNEVHYNLQCNNGDWEIINRQPTALRSNASYSCSDCTIQTVNDYHCTSKSLELFSVCILICVSHRF